MDRVLQLIAIVVVVVVLALMTPPPAHSQTPQQQVVFENVFSGITLAQASAPLRNVGQGMHLLKVTFPLENTTITGLTIQLEWSRDGVNWRPAGPAIGTAPVLTNGAGATDVIAYRTYYGVFRSIRINNVTNTTGGALATVKYIGTYIPVLPFATLQSDRWTF